MRMAQFFTQPRVKTYDKFWGQEQFLVSVPAKTRVGQYFVNTYIKHPWPELYYEEDAQKALFIIGLWLTDHDYSFTNLPQSIN